MHTTSIYCSVPVSVCYDNEDGVTTPDAGVTEVPAPQVESINDAIDADVKPPEGFTPEQQAAFNEALAKDRRRHAAKLQAVENQLTSVMETAQLTETEKAELEESRVVLQRQLMTKDQIAAKERQTLQQKYAEELKSEREAREKAENKYLDATISRAITDAAVKGDAFNPDQIVRELKDKTVLIEDKPMVNFPDIHVDTGESIITQLSPSEAVARMKEIEEHKNLFNSGVVSGVGGGSGPGDAAQLGKVNVKNLTPTQYAELRKTNPEALGLK